MEGLRVDDADWRAVSAGLYGSGGARQALGGEEFGIELAAGESSRENRRTRSLEVAVKTLADKWPEISAHLRPLLAPPVGRRLGAQRAAASFCRDGQAAASPPPQPSPSVLRGLEPPPLLPSSAHISKHRSRPQPSPSSSAAEEVQSPPVNPRNDFPAA